MIERLVALLFGLATCAVIVAFGLGQRDRRLKGFVHSLAGVLDGPCREVFDYPVSAELFGVHDGRPVRIRLQILSDISKLTVAVACHARALFSFTRDDSGQLQDAFSVFAPRARAAARALIEQHGVFSVTLDALQIGIPPDKQPYRLEVVLDSSKRPDLDPNRIGAVMRDAVALAALCERAVG